MNRMNRAPALRLALFGGSFDPIHRGHLHVARAALEHFRFDQIHFLPALVPPHKREHSLLPVEDRLDLLCAALRDEPRFLIEEDEIRRGGSSYTFDTLSRLRAAKPPGTRLFFLIGGDSLQDLPKWHRAADLVREFTLVTVPRDRQGPAEDWLKPLRAAFPKEDVERLERHVLPVEPLPISSTEVRERVRRGLSIDALVPEGVAALIAARGYYFEG